MSKQLSIFISQDKDNYNANNKDIKLKKKIVLGHTHTTQLPRAVVLSLKDRYQRIITEAAEVNGRICSITRKLQYLFINKMRTRPILNLNVHKLNE